jgi:hypothetical protein
MLRIDAVKALQQRWQAEAQAVPMDRAGAEAVGRLPQADRRRLRAQDGRSARRPRPALGEHDRMVLEAAKALDAANAVGRRAEDPRRHGGPGGGAARPGRWVQALSAAPGGDAGEALLRLEMAAELPTPAEHLNARRALQLQLLTRRNDPAPAQTWGQDTARVLASAHDASRPRAVCRTR